MTLIGFAKEVDVSKFADPRRVVVGFLSVALGVWFYCLVVAPLLSDRDYGTVALEKAKSLGLGNTLVIIVLATVWVLVIKWRNRK